MSNTSEPKVRKSKTKTPAVEPVVESATEDGMTPKDAEKSVNAEPMIATDDAAAAQIIENAAKKPDKKKKNEKIKVIRDSFSFPEQDYLKILELKKTCLEAGIHVKKNEILRAGLQLLAKLNLTELQQAVENVEKIKTGRPKS